MYDSAQTSSYKLPMIFREMGIIEKKKVPLNILQKVSNGINKAADNLIIEK